MVLEGDLPFEYECKLSIKGFSRSLSSCVFSPDGAWFACASGDNKILLFEVPTFTLIQTFKAHTAGVSSLEFSGDSRFLASASDDRTVRIWEIIDDASDMPRYSDPYSGSRLYGSRTQRVTDNEGGSADATVQSAVAFQHDQDSEYSLRTLNGHVSAVFCVAWHPRGTILVSGGMDETVRLWNIQTGKCIRVLPAHSDPVSAVCFSRDGSLIASCSWDGYVRLWNANTGQCLKTMTDDDNIPFTDVYFSPNSKYLFATTLNSTIHLWDYNTSKVVKSYTGHLNVKYCIRSFLSPCGKYLYSGSEDNKVYIWDIQTRSIVRCFETHKDFVLALALHPSRNILAAGGRERDAVVRIYLGQNEDDIVIGEESDDIKYTNESTDTEEDDNMSSRGANESSIKKEDSALANGHTNGNVH